MVVCSEATISVLTFSTSLITTADEDAGVFLAFSGDRKIEDV